MKRSMVYFIIFLLLTVTIQAQQTYYTWKGGSGCVDVTAGQFTNYRTVNPGNPIGAFTVVKYNNVSGEYKQVVGANIGGGLKFIPFYLPKKMILEVIHTTNHSPVVVNDSLRRTWM